MSDELSPETLAKGGGVLAFLASLFGAVKVGAAGIQAEVKALREEVAALRLALAAEADSRETALERVRERLEGSANAHRGQLDDHGTRLGRVEGYLGALGSGPAELQGRKP